MIRFQDITVDRSRRTIACNGKVVQFTPLLFRFACSLLLAGPMMKPALFDLLYDDREDGGPLGGLKMIDVLLCQIKPKLARLGLTLRSDGERYWWNKRHWAESINRKAGDATERSEEKTLHAQAAPCRTQRERPL